jgi:pilus assembly protein CpaE
MTQILVIDDEAIFHNMVSHALEGLNYKISFAENGITGLTMAEALKPDMIITDVMMPDITGYEVTRRLRRDPLFAKTPILVMTAKSDLQDKLKSFESGADDHLTKPFEPAELAARVHSLLKRVVLTEDPLLTTPKETARMISVHSLRGGTGCSSLAVNLAVSLYSLWHTSTILLDLNMMAGQVALMLNMPLKRTWADIARFDPSDLDAEVLESVVTRHDSGLSIIAAPTLPAQAETLKNEILSAALGMIRLHYDYVVADLPHDFNEPTLQALDLSDIVLVVATPDLASVRAVAAALNTYQRLGYPSEKIKLVLNATFPRMGLPREKIESALGIPISILIPYTQDLFVESINLGQPFVLTKPKEPVSELVEDYAFRLSKTEYKKTRPSKPTEAWSRVYKRYVEKRK